ncbi:carboxypeptidase B-like [Acanthaster planci]|uniref:Carboxypeptidase B-like n=1 Tax=Acanthaster planci TaxID=133434 RepID=A0A8B7YDG2_ACAPL|nr:carboxypeptidase B-like [Acanthaster planci]
MKSLFVLMTLFAVSHGKSYDGYQVFEITPKTGIQFQQMMDLDMELFDDLDFLKTSAVGKPSKVIVPPMHVDKLKEALEELRIEFEVYIDNLQPLIDEETRAITSREKATTLASFDYNVYHSAQEILDWVTDFSQTESTSSLTIKEIYLGDSAEGFAMKALKISTGSGRLGAYTQGGLHGREWIAPATVLNLVQKFVAAFKSGDSVATQFFNKFDWYVLPLLNPDGYHYTRPESPSFDRLWRKNRQQVSSFCKGIAMNRNYGYKWGGDDTSSNPCSEIYKGGYAYEAQELKLMTDWLLSLKKSQTFMIHMDLHSYGQDWFYPYSYTSSIATSDDAELVDPAAGASTDFGYEILGATYSYTVEMRDTGHYGFELPENQIEPCAEEMYAAFIELFSQVLSKV